MFDDPRGKKIDGHFHVFITVESCHKVEVANVEAHIMRLWSAEDTVPRQFGGCHVGGARGMFPRIVYQISPHCDSDSVWILLLRMIGNNDFVICGGLIFWDIWDLFRFHNKHCVLPLCPCLVVTLTHAAEIFPKIPHPNVLHSRVLHQLAVACDVLASDGMLHSKGIVFEAGSRDVFRTEFEWGKLR